ncbi:hypothetical protein Nepgr_012475 [Nepenthes gracilis]|uniref:Uncharacterized protein n=1 Tax=Nepenthes gracilis TaxID=150966 RepID=A0AAD3XN61_NEPGR|nr:hypothetical protein Nepgr_012475 [Nepenthes gracilis]
MSRVPLIVMQPVAGRMLDWCAVFGDAPADPAAVFSCYWILQFSGFVVEQGLVEEYSMLLGHGPMLHWMGRE